MGERLKYIVGLLWVALAVLIAALLAFGISPVVQMIPWSYEKAIAATVVAPSDLFREHDSHYQALIDKIVHRIYPLDEKDNQFSISVRVIKSSTVNAYAELGGNIFITTALLQKAQSPEEVAGVLSHEIEHVKRRHILEGFAVRMITVGALQYVTGGQTSSTQWTDFFLRMGFSRGQEAQADEGAIERLRKAQVDNRGFADFFERESNAFHIPAFLSDHPTNESRLEEVRRAPH